MKSRNEGNGLNPPPYSSQQQYQRQASNMSEFEGSSVMTDKIPIPEPLGPSTSSAAIPQKQRVASQNNLAAALVVGSIQDIRQTERLNDKILDMERSGTGGAASSLSIYQTTSSLDVGAGGADGLATLAVPPVGAFSSLFTAFFHFIYVLLAPTNRFNESVSLAASSLQLLKSSHPNWHFLYALPALSEWFIIIVTDMQMSMWPFHRKIFLYDSIRSANAATNATTTDGTWARAVFNIIDYRAIVADGLDETSHLVLFSLSLLAVALVLGLFLWTFYLGTQGKLDMRMRSANALKWLWLLSSTLFFLPILNNLTSGTDCLVLTSPKINATYVYDLYPKYGPVSCGSGSNITLALFGTLFAIIHVALSCIYSFYHACGALSNPALDNAAARTHGRVDLWYTLIRVVIIVFYKAGDAVTPFVLSSFSTLGSALCAWLMLRYYPHYNEHVNHVRFGIFTAATIVNLAIAIFSALLFAKTSSSVKINYYGPDLNLTSSLVGIWAPVVLIGYYVSRAYLRFLVNKIDGLLFAYDSIPNNPSRSKILVFPSWQHVEISARSILQRSRRGPAEDCMFVLDYRTDWNAFKRRFEHGRKEFQNNREVVLAYLGYLNVLCSSDMRASQSNQEQETRARLEMNQTYLDVVKELPRYLQPNRQKTVSFLSRKWTDFQVYFVSRSLTQAHETRELRGSQLIWQQYKDLEFKAEKKHHESMRWFKKAWKLVLRKDYDEIVLTNYSIKALEARDEAIEAYEQLVRNCPQSQLIRRKYAAFLMQIGHEPEQVVKLMEDAMSKRGGKSLPKDPNLVIEK